MERPKYPQLFNRLQDTLLRGKSASETLTLPSRWSGHPIPIPREMAAPSSPGDRVAHPTGATVVMPPKPTVFNSRASKGARFFVRAVCAKQFHLSNRSGFDKFRSWLDGLAPPVSGSHSLSH